MTSPIRSRRWPHRNFLDELEPDLRQPDAIEDLAHRDPNLRNAYRALRRWSRKIRSKVPSSDWASFRDARVVIQTMEFELAFNLGFETGHLARRTGLSPRPTRRGRTDLDLATLAALQRLLRTKGAPKHAATLLVRLASALLEPEPPRGADSVAPLPAGRRRDTPE
jgi:hypothetical protein